MEGIIFMGLQASGKSSFYKQKFFNTHLRLSMDMLNTRNKEGIFLKTALDIQQRVVIDNTNPTQREREKYITAFKARKYKIIGYYFHSDLAACLERNKQRNGKECIPEKGLYATKKRIDSPLYSEGFDELYFVSIGNNGFEIKKYNNEI